MPSQRKRSASPPKKKRKRKWRRRLVLLLLLLAGLVAAAPTVISRTHLRDTLLALALPTSGWQVESRSGELGWTTTQVLEGVSIADVAGRPLLSVDSITLERPLWALLLSQRDLGKLRLVRPIVHVETRPDGSNWEDFLQAAATQESAPGDTQARSKSTPPVLELEVVDGEVRGLDATTQQQWALAQVNLAGNLGDASPGAAEIAGSAVLLTGAGGNSGDLQVKLRTIAAGQQQLELTATQLPLAPLEPWLARALPGSRLTGSVSTTTRVRWTHDPKRGLLVQSDGRLEGDQLAFVADALAGDRLACARLVSPWQVSFADEQLTIEQLDVDADWAHLQATGVVDLGELAALDGQRLPRQRTQLSGSVALDRLAAMLPRTLQLRQGVRIDAGKLEFSAEGQPTADRVVWTASASVADLAGSDGRRPIRWKKPIEATAELTDSGQGAQVDQLALASPFASAALKATADGANGKFAFDLDQLSQELAQFVDLQAWQLRGRGEGTLTVARQSSDKFDAQADVQLNELHVARDARTLWTEESLVAELHATGTEQDLRPARLSTASMKLRGAQDQFEVKLLEPVDFREADPTWKLKASGQGSLDSWGGRLRPWVASMPQQVAGNAKWEADLEVAGGRVQVSQSSGTLLELRVQGDQLAINEPRVQFSGDMSWDSQAQTLAMRESKLISSSLAFQTQGVQVKLGTESAPVATGSVAWRADLERMSSIFKRASVPNSTWARGEAVGQLHMRSDAEQLSADMTISATPLQLVRTASGAGADLGNPEIAWSEPQLQLTGRAVYDRHNDRAQLEKFELRGKTLRLNGAATVDQLRNAGLLQASGLLEYDSAELAQLVSAYLGPEVQLQGDRQVRFQAAGSLFDETSAGTASHWSQRWKVTADAGWTVASVYGLPLSGGKLQGTLRDGQLQIAPLDVTVGQGRLTAAPRAVLAPQPQTLFLPQGPLISQVALSPQVSETLLKYAAPILAGATRTEGEFSIDLEGTQVPLENPKLARVAGRLSVHRLRITPGPMISQIAGLVGQVEALTKRKPLLQAVSSPRETKALTMTDRQIEFQVVEGRVYHRDLEFLIDDVPVRSYGSVGFDQTLALVIEVPIQEKWVEGERLLRSLAGKKLQIPIHGTFQKPRIDERAIADLSSQLLQGAAGQAIGDEINRQLEKLLRGK